MYVCMCVCVCVCGRLLDTFIGSLMCRCAYVLVRMQEVIASKWLLVCMRMYFFDVPSHFVVGFMRGTVISYA
jgi:hypothetical protein